MTMQNKPLTTTLRKVREVAGSSHERVRAAIRLRDVLDKNDFDDEPVQYSTIFKILGPDHAIWFLRAENDYMEECAMLAIRLCALLPQERNALARQSMRIFQNYYYKNKISGNIDSLIDKMEDESSLVDDAMSGASQACTAFTNGYTAQALSLALKCVKASTESGVEKQPLKWQSCELVYMVYKDVRAALYNAFDSEAFPFDYTSAVKISYWGIIDRQLEFNFLLVAGGDGA